MPRHDDTGPAAENVIDRVVAYFAPRAALSRRRARILLSAAYKSADISRLKNRWILPGTSGTDPTPDEWDLSVIRERSRDANRNDPVASGATDTMELNIVGSGLKPQARIRADRLGISESKAAKLNRQAEMAWAHFTPFADAANRLDFDEIQFLVLRKIIEDGESIVIPGEAKEPWRPFFRALEVLEADRLESPMSADHRDKNIVSGVEMGPRGQVEAYHIKSDAAEGGYRRYTARDGKGRPNVLHIFRSKRPGQVRGIPHFSPVLSYFEDLASYLEAEVVAARVAACLAVFITKQDPMATAITMGPETETATNARIQEVEPGMVGYHNTGESINVVDPKRPGDTFPSFMETVLRLIGVSLGLPYELLIKDFSKTNYSSARAALLEGRRMFTNWRNWLSRKLCQPVWELVLEEAMLRGIFRVNRYEFYENKPEYCRAVWIGGGWGWVDPTKEAEAAKMAVDYGLSTMAEEAAAQGRDWEEVLEQRKREQDRAAELGVVLGSPEKRKTQDTEKGDAKEE